MIVKLIKIGLKSVLQVSVILLALVATPTLAAQKNTVQNKAVQTILIFGDSLSAGYGLAANEGWVYLLQKKLTKLKTNASLINASISGETTSGGASRIDAALEQHKPTIIIVELGANDGLQGLPMSQMQTNLRQIMAAAQAKKVKVVLLGMKIPPNYGTQYTRQFSQHYVTLAKEFRANLVPFFLENVAAKPELLQADGLHPNAAAQPTLLQNVWPQLQPLLNKPN